jgi:uncharacterized protein (DUF1800 family)
MGELQDLDSDSDQITDWAEYAMEGYSPTNSASAGADDYLVLSNALAAANATISVSAVMPAAFESTGEAACFRVERNGTLDALTVNFAMGGFTNGTRGSASAGDYALKDAAGNPLGGSITLPFGSTGAEVFIEPVDDAVDEVPEVVSLQLLPDAGYVLGASNLAMVTVNDAEDTPENEKLFFAYMTTQGAATTASGYSVLYLSGDNATARVSVFPVTSGNLTSPEIEKHIHSGETGQIFEQFDVKDAQGSIVTNEFGEPIPVIGTVLDYNVSVDFMQLAAGFTNNQQFLDMLLAGNIFINIHTANFPHGEIKGFYNRQTGSTELVVPPAPPPITALSSNDLVRDVTRFLTQATFGPTGQEVSNLVYSVTNTFNGDRMAAYTNWIDTQFALDQTSVYDYTKAANNQEWELLGYGAYTNTLFPPYPANSYPLGQPRHNNRRRGHWLLMIKAHDQLRQRMAFAWSQIMVVSEANAKVKNNQYGAAKYYDMLAENADDTYRELLGDVSYHPIMGKYLSHLKNEKEVLDGMGNVLVSPDENYAREIMQLFSIGLIRRHLDGTIKLGPDGLPIPTYDNADITELARIFTGLSFSKYANNVDSSTNSYTLLDNYYFERGDGNRYYGGRFEYPMKMFGDRHDPGAKLILDDVSINNTNIVDLSDRGVQDIEDALDAIHAHSNVAPFISRLLIQRLVTSNPSAGYIYRVARVFEDNGSGVRGDLKAVTKAILLDYEARSLDLIDDVGYGKQKEPLIRYVALLRAFAAASELALSDLSAYGYPAGQLDNFPAGTSRYRFGDTDGTLGQTPLGAPSVFNWFLPDYTPGGAIAAAGLKAPEFQITTESSVIKSINYHNSICQWNYGQGGTPLVGDDPDLKEDHIVLDRASLIGLHDTSITNGASQQEAVTLVVDHIDALLMAGRFKVKYESAAEPNPRSIIIEAMLPTSNSDTRIRDILYLMSTCADYNIQK